MTHNHWSYRFPYLVPVWHSLGYQNMHKLSENSVDPNLDIDIGGIGMYSNTAHRRYGRNHYDIRRPMLPFYVDANRNASSYAANNCLAYCPRRNLLFSSKFDKITALDLNINGKRFDVEANEIDSNTSHWCSVNKQVPINPFCFDVDNIWEYKVLSNKKSWQILDLKLYDDGTDLDVMIHSRNSLQIFKYLTEERDLGSNDFLKLKFDIYSSSSLFAGSKKLDFYDRNPDIYDEFLVTFVSDNCVYRWDIEQNKITTELELDLGQQQTHVNNFIGVNWAKNLNPFLFFYGTHKEIFLGDTRQNINNGLRKSSISIMNASQFAYFREFELFQTFTLNPIEPHQIITASDFNINFFDLRFPNKNLLQFKDMFTDRLTNKLETCKLNKQNDEKLLLLASNSHRCCLYTFDTKSCIQPVMEHVPCYINLPSDTEQCFPTTQNGTNNCFFRGMQIMPGNFCDDNSTNKHDFFTVSLLSNNGDIFMQDYWLSAQQEQSMRTNSNDLNEFKYEFDYGKKNCLKFLSDIITTEYMKKVQNLIDNINKTMTNLSLDTEYSLKCFDCLGNCSSPKRVHEDSSSDSDFDDFFDSKPRNCPNYEGNLCLCRKTNLSPIVYQNDDLVSSKDCKILDGRMKFMDNDPLDLNMLRQNWTSPINNERSDDLRSLISQICTPKTAILFDRWCEDHQLADDS